MPSPRHRASIKAAVEHLVILTDRLAGEYRSYAVLNDAEKKQFADLTIARDHLVNALRSIEEASECTSPKRKKAGGIR